MASTSTSTTTPNQLDSKNGNGPKSNTTNQPSKSIDDDSKKKRPIFSKSLGTAAGLSKLLPTGTTLAFQTMAPSFTRGGACEDHDVNFAFTCGLIVFLTLLTAALNFTDSVQGKDGNTHYGIVVLRVWNKIYFVPRC
ncbi:protein DMP10-like [Miscanthus floridulus]|uniref:protein DMP10-like n=1 Tax=Miscanthus floridulus TaxID=154761 RepID=UPI00345B43D3